MRIAFLTPEYVTEKNFDGGLANHLGRVCPMLAQKGHEVVVIVASDRQGRIVQDGVEVLRVPLWSSALLWLNRITLFRLPALTRWLLQSFLLNRACASLHSERPFDLVQYASFTATGLFRLRSAPAVIRLSSYEPLWQKAYGLQTSIQSRLMAWLETAAIKKADVVFGPSRRIAEVVGEKTGASVEVIEPPFSPSDVVWDEQPCRDLLENKEFLLFFGTLGVLKGVATIAEILPVLLDDHQDLNFVFVGKNTDLQGRPMIEHVWEKAGSFRGRVLYLGQMRHEQLHPILSRASAVVLPSRIDNLPNTCLEAMAFGRIVIGTWGASFEQLITDGENGFLCEIDSPESLRAAIEKALSLSVEEKEAMGARGVRRIEELEPEKALARLIAFYEDLICDQPSGSRTKAS